MGSSKIKANRNREKPKKRKEKAKRNKKGDQGSPREKKNIKCQDNEHENVFEDNLTESNEYSEDYQMYKNMQIPDLLNRFKDPTEARMRPNIVWNELSEAGVSHFGGCLYEVS